MRGECRIALKDTANVGSRLELTFEDPRGFIADRFLLSLNQPVPAANEVAEPARETSAWKVEESPGAITVRSERAVWAIGMAVFTLRNINKNKLFCSGGEVKISRQTLRSIIMVCNMTQRNDFLLAGLFAWLTHDLPAALTNAAGSRGEPPLP